MKPIELFDDGELMIERGFDGGDLDRHIEEVVDELSFQSNIDGEKPKVYITDIEKWVRETFIAGITYAYENRESESDNVWEAVRERLYVREGPDTDPLLLLGVRRNIGSMLADCPTDTTLTEVFSGRRFKRVVRVEVVEVNDKGEKVDDGE